MTAVVLAAGMGRRLGHVTASCPKCLLRVGGETVLGAALSRIRHAGVRDAMVVVGFEADRVRRHVRTLDLAGLRVRFARNAEYERTNNLRSLALALERLDGPVTIINGDDLFNEGILKALLHADADAAAVVDYGPLPADAMRVEIDTSRVVTLGKRLDLDRAAANAIGMYRFAGAPLVALRDEVFTRDARGDSNAFYVDAIAGVAVRHPIRAVSTAGLTWGEIDDAHDLAGAPARMAAILAEEWIAATLDEPLAHLVLAGAPSPVQRVERMSRLRRLVESGIPATDLEVRYA